MFVPPPASARRNLLDGGFTLAALSLAVVIGYAVLSPPDRKLARTETVGRVAVVAGSRPSAPPAPRGPGAVRAADEWAEPATPSITLSGLAPAPPPAPRPRAVDPTPRAVEPAAKPRRAPALLEPGDPDATWPSSTVSGHVADQDRRPLAGASVVVGGREVRTADDGTFTVKKVPPDASLLVKLPGYAKVQVPPTRGVVEVVLEPQTIRAAYLTYYGMGDRGIRGRVLDLLARTELNAVVIDVKGDRGWILYPTTVELAGAAYGPGTLREFDAMMADLKARGIYTIARIVTFKDNVLAQHRPDLAIIDTRTGTPWIDNEKLAWVDPFREEVWAYNIAVALEAVRRGFDEVQFDYVRFPTDGRLGAAKYSQPNTRHTRLPAIAGFLERARRELGAAGAFVAADVFGYTAFNENDTDIGQRIEELAPHLDFICPMVYPSGYHKGIPGTLNPVANPYRVVHESVRLIRKRAAPHTARVRPWLQDFRDYAFDRRVFGVAEIQAQIKGSDDAGGTGWMLWNPRNDYTGEALRQKDSLAAQ